MVWLEFNLQARHEQAGRRPALVLSPQAYNEKVRLMICCPITLKTKGYPFEVRLPDRFKLEGVILADQVKSLNWKARQAQFVARMADETLAEVLAKLGTLLA